MEANNQSFKRSSELFQTFWRVNLSLKKVVQKTAVKNDLTVPQYAVLMTFAPRREMTQKEVGQIMQFPKSTLSQAVDGLVQAGYIDRHPVKENRREMQLILSEKGKKLYEHLKTEEGSMHQAFKEAADTLTEGQYSNLMASLAQIANFLEDMTGDQGEGSND